MRRGRSFWGVMGCLMLVLFVACGARSQSLEVDNWTRIESRYCTIWIHPDVAVKQASKQISVWRVWPRVKVAAKGNSPEAELAAKCDTLFRRAEEILDMYPPGVHTTIKIAKHRDQIRGAHAARYGFGTKAEAFYVFEENTIYAAYKDLSESVLVHEMAHCIIDHYFRVRPPSKIEEMLAIHVDTQLRG